MPSKAEFSPPRAILTRADKDGVAVLTLDHPARRNALSEAMLAGLDEAFSAIAKDRSVRCVVLAATGTVFSAGHDLKELTAHRDDADRGRTYFTDILGRCAQVMQAIARLPQPVIASVQGVATAAGCQLVASCDLAVASETARFCTPGVEIGLFCSTPMVALSRNVSAKHAMEMLLTADMVSADRAREIGLVNRVVPAADLAAETMALAAGIAARSAATVSLGKAAFYRQRGMDLSDAYDYATAVMVENMLSRDADVGISAFLDKVPARWSNP